MEHWVKPWLEEIDTILKAVISFIRMVIKACLSDVDKAAQRGCYNEKQKPKRILEHKRTPKLRRLLGASRTTRAQGHLPSKTSTD